MERHEHLRRAAQGVTCGLLPVQMKPWQNLQVSSLRLLYTWRSSRVLFARRKAPDT